MWKISRKTESFNNVKTFTQKVGALKKAIFHMKYVNLLQLMAYIFDQLYFRSKFKKDTKSLIKIHENFPLSPLSCSGHIHVPQIYKYSMYPHLLEEEMDIKPLEVKTSWQSS